MNNITCGIRMTATRTKTYSNVNNGQPVVEAYFYVSIGKKVEDEFGTHSVCINHGKFSLVFLTKEDAKNGAILLRESAKPIFLNSYLNKTKIKIRQIMDIAKAIA